MAALNAPYGSNGLIVMWWCAYGWRYGWRWCGDMGSVWMALVWRRYGVMGSAGKRIK